MQGPGRHLHFSLKYSLTDRWYIDRQMGAWTFIVLLLVTKLVSEQNDEADMEKKLTTFVSRQKI